MTRLEVGQSDCTSRRFCCRRKMLVIFAFILVVLPSSRAIQEGQLITCVCTTSDCQSEDVGTCTTPTLCYTQFLNKGDGSNSVTRGCVTQRTPLLCENRLPAVDHARWPYLLCCNSSMCNKEGAPLPTSPPRPLDIGLKKKDNHSVESMTILRDDILNLLAIKQKASKTSTTSSSPSPMHIAVMTVLVVGLCLLVVIGTTGTYILRRQRFSAGAQGYSRAPEIRVESSEESSEQVKPSVYVPSV